MTIYKHKASGRLYLIYKVFPAASKHTGYFYVAEPYQHSHAFALNKKFKDLSAFEAVGKR